MVQIYINRQWSTVCGRIGFDDTAAAIVCKELGFNNGTALPLGVFGQQRFDTVRPNITCTGNETTLMNCSYDKSLSTLCLPYSVSYASVACYNRPTTGMWNN